VDREQQINLYFEMAKHFTTLNTAALLVFLAAREEINLPLWIALFFAISLASATLGRIEVARKGLPRSRFALVYLGLTIAIVFFFAGVYNSVRLGLGW
jgi:hypothetical protein